MGYFREHSSCQQLGTIIPAVIYHIRQMSALLSFEKILPRPFSNKNLLRRVSPSSLVRFAPGSYNVSPVRLLRTLRSRALSMGTAFDKLSILSQVVLVSP